MPISLLLQDMTEDLVDEIPDAYMVFLEGTEVKVTPALIRFLKGEFWDLPTATFAPLGELPGCEATLSLLKIDVGKLDSSFGRPPLPQMGATYDEVTESFTLETNTSAHEASTRVAAIVRYLAGYILMVELQQRYYPRIKALLQLESPDVAALTVTLESFTTQLVDLHDASQRLVPPETSGTRVLYTNERRSSRARKRPSRFIDEQ